MIYHKIMLTLEEYLGGNYPAIYHVVVTGKCNAACEGCINTLVYGNRAEFANSWEEGIESNLQALRYLLSNQRNGAPTYVAFYGGEPLLVPERMKFLKENLEKEFSNKNLKYILFTNGMLLDSPLFDDPSFARALSLLIVSIDGRKDQHERVRRGTSLEKIEKNLRHFREKFEVPVLMWSTLRENMSFRDCLEEFFNLHEKKCCDYFFWHLIEGDSPIENFDRFSKAYMEDLTYLMDRFVASLGSGSILPVLPFCELFFFLLKEIRRGHTGCGIERLRNFDVVSGKILPCVDLGEEIVFEDLHKLESVKGILGRITDYKKELGCNFCPAEFYCGGRCPVLVKTSPLRARQYCLLMREMIKLAEERLEEVKKALTVNSLRAEDLYFPYGYMTLLTDVVP